MHATKAAVEEGIVPGGGVALLRAIDAVAKVKGDSHDIDVGVKIVRRALEEPTRQIVNNSGEEGSVVVRELMSTNGSTGYTRSGSFKTDSQGRLCTSEGWLLEPQVTVQEAFDSLLVPEDHVWSERMLPWIVLEDDLPRYGRGREDS